MNIVVNRFFKATFIYNRISVSVEEITNIYIWKTQGSWCYRNGFLCAPDKKKKPVAMSHKVSVSVLSLTTHTEIQMMFSGNKLFES